MEDIMRERRIDTLYHFTQARNLKNIFRHGILPRNTLDRQEITSYYNDDYRYDDCEDAVCTSIEFPNYRMFYKLRQENPQIDWAVLALDANIMCDSECAFCWTNAGDATMYNEPIENRMGVVAFLELFGNRTGYPQRETLQIPACYPTNPQAEVLVFNVIPIGYIRKVCFEDNIALQKYRGVIPVGIPAHVEQRVFGARNDWAAWKS